MTRLVLTALGVILPLLSLLVETITRVCAHTFFDPLPTPAHCLLWAVVPLSAFALGVTGGAVRPTLHRPLALLAGAGLGVAGAYTLFFLPITPLAVMLVLALLVAMQRGLPRGTVAVGAACALLALALLELPALGVRTGLAALHRLEGLRLAALAALTLAGIVAANGLRAAALFYPEAGLLDLPAWTHGGTGAVVFAAAAAALAAAARRLEPCPA